MIRLQGTGVLARKQGLQKRHRAFRLLDLVLLLSRLQTARPAVRRAILFAKAIMSAPDMPTRNDDSFLIASPKKNSEFHALFKSVPTLEVLIDGRSLVCSVSQAGA